MGESAAQRVDFQVLALTSARRDESALNVDRFICWNGLQEGGALVVFVEQEERMKNNNCLSTRTEKCCPQCGEEFILAEPTDVLASRPIQVSLICPDCHFPGQATLTAQNHFRSVFPSPAASSPVGVANDNTGWLTAQAFDPVPRFVRPAAQRDDAPHPQVTLIP